MTAKLSIPIVSSRFTRLFLLLPLLVVFSVVTQAATPLTIPRPNILIAVADDWSWPHAGIAGTTWVKTPNFDRLAREGLLFQHAYTPVAKCAASRATLLTGRNPWLLEAGFTHWNFFPTNYRTYPEALAANGYFAGYTGKGWSPGVATNAQGKPRMLLGQNFSSARLRPPTTAIAAVDYAANFSQFMNAAGEKPWLFWYGCNEPHRDYEFQSGVKKGGKRLSDLDRVPGYWPDSETVRHDILDYALEIEHFDAHLGKMVQLLEERGQLTNTLIIVTSDNGMPFPRAKGQTYEISSHLPLAIHWPAGIPHPGRVIADHVSFTDIAPTMLNAAGVAWADSGMAEFSGRSLLPLLASVQSGQIDPARDHVLLGRERHDPGRPHNQGYPIRAIVQDNLLYLHNFAPDRWPASNPETGYLDVDDSPTKTVILEARRQKGFDAHWELSFGKRPAEELYDLAADPDCLANLAGRPTLATRQAAMRERLFAALRAQGDPRLAGRDDFFDAFPYANPNMNDLYERWKRGEAKLPHWIGPKDPEQQPLD
jgi:N-sulfoglucosamine sulfohydrolase